jgi:DNA repair protein RadC
MITPLDLKDRAVLYGIDHLTDAELLSLTTGIDRVRLQGALEEFGLQDLLGRIDVMDLTVPQKMKMEAAFALSQRISIARISPGALIVRSPDDIGPLFVAQLQLKTVETAMIAMLDNRGRLIRIETMATGTINSAMIIARDIAKIALRFNAVCVILAHNHPSGETEPSEADVKASRQLLESLDTIGVRLTDSLVIGNGEYTSLKRKGLL